MNHKKNDLKEALKKMRVHEPLKLREPGQQSKDEVTQNELPQSRVALPAQNKLPQIEVAALEPAQSEVPKSEATDSGYASRREAQRKLPQNELANNDQSNDEIAQPEAAENEELSSSKGFFKLAHSIFADPRMREISGDGFRLYLWFASKAWRFPQSNGTLRASIRYIEEGTGIPHATISRCLATLKEKELITLLETNYKKGNRWYISKCAINNGGPGERPSQFKLPHIEQAKNVEEASSDRGSNHLKLSKHLPQNGPNIRIIKNKKELIRKQNSNFKIGMNCDPKFESPEETEKVDMSMAITAFEESLDEPTRNLLKSRYSESKFPHGYLPPEGVIHRLTALAWFREELSETKKVAAN